MANTFREKELKTSWPFEEGLTAETTRQTKEKSLKPEQSFVPARYKVGLD